MGTPVRQDTLSAVGLDDRLIEQDLVTRIRTGDAEAFEELVRAYASGLLSFAFAQVGSSDAAEDIVQDVFLGIWARRAQWEPRFAVKAYLYGAVLHRASNYHRNKRHEHTVIQRLVTDRDPLDQQAAPDQADTLLTTGEFEIAVGQAVESLSPRTREVFMLSRGRQLSYREIAESLGITVKTVEFHMARALSVLRDRLADWRPGAS